MNERCASHMVRTSYYTFYQKWYAPRFMAIDVMLKTMDAPVSVPEAAKYLYISEEDVRRVMARESLEKLDKNGFLTVMRHGDSDICRLYQREITHGVKDYYLPADIAYIYGLQTAHVEAACQKWGLSVLPASKVPEILDEIPVFILY